MIIILIQLRNPISFMIKMNLPLLPNRTLLLWMKTGRPGIAASSVTVNIQQSGILVFMSDFTFPKGNLSSAIVVAGGLTRRAHWTCIFSDMTRTNTNAKFVFKFLASQIFFKDTRRLPMVTERDPHQHL